jgi:hypothetical protein
MPAVRGESAVPIAAVFTQNWGIRSIDFAPQILVAVYRDGRILWSRDTLTGGPPYATGDVPPETIYRTLEALEAQGVFEGLTRQEGHYSPHGIFTGIAISDGDRRLMMLSWHEFAESDGASVRTSSGLQPLRGRSRSQVLADQPESYRRFRENWSALRDALNALIPNARREGGNLVFEMRPLKPPANTTATPGQG